MLILFVVFSIIYTSIEIEPKNLKTLKIVLLWRKKILNGNAYLFYLWSTYLLLVEFGVTLISPYLSC